MIHVINDDCLEALRGFEDNSIDHIVTDPPYGLAFMGENWDHGVPGRRFWREMLRVCKPGSFLLAFGGTRTFHRLACNIEDAGWEIRDCLMFLHGMGFPKSFNIGKKIDSFDGYGTAFKPAFEPIICAMKPIDKNFVNNALKWGLAGLNIDACRIEYKNDSDRDQARVPQLKLNSKTGLIYGFKTGEGRIDGEYHDVSKGRFPANVILSHSPDCRITGTQSVGNKERDSLQDTDHKGNARFQYSDQRHQFTYGKEEVPIYECVEGCPVKSLNSQSQNASRFFYTAKASRKERGEGNNHPTVKPLALMEYLIKLVSAPKPGIILDPFAGSGTTLLACKRLQIPCIGIEKEPDYVEIIKRRIDYVSGQIDLFEV